MDRKMIITHKAPIPAAPYSQAIKYNNVVYTSGAVGINPQTGLVVQGGILPQMKQALDNIEAILNQADTSLKNALKVNVFLRNMNDFPIMNTIYREYFDKEALPARTTVEVGPFALEELLVEIDVIAYIPQ